MPRRLVVTFCAFLVATPTMGQNGAIGGGKPKATDAPPKKAGDGPPMTIRVYDVGDIAIAPPAYPYRGTAVAGLRLGADEAPVFSNPNPNVPPAKPAAALLGGAEGSRDAVAMTDVIQTLQAIVAPDSWHAGGHAGDNVSVHGEASALGRMLVVRQTEENHRQIEMLLRDLRGQGGARRTLRVTARWFLLPAADLQKLTATIDAPAPKEGESPLDKLARETGALVAQVTCLDGQTVSLVSGRARTVVHGAVPVISGSAAAFDYRVAHPQTGALLQVTPRRTAEGAVRLDVQSLVTRPDKAGDPITPPEPQVEVKGAMVDLKGSNAPKLAIDRVNVVVQQLATTLEAPLGRPTLAGGFTFDARPGEPKADAQLLLVVAVDAVGP